MSPEECEQVGESEKKSKRSQILQVNLSLLTAILSDTGRTEKGQDMVFILGEHSDC